METSDRAALITAIAVVAVLNVIVFTLFRKVEPLVVANAAMTFIALVAVALRSSPSARASDIGFRLGTSDLDQVRRKYRDYRGRDFWYWVFGVAFIPRYAWLSVRYGFMTPNLSVQPARPASPSSRMPYDTASEARDLSVGTVGRPKLLLRERCHSTIIQFLLRGSGLQMETRFGDFSYAPFESKSPRQVCICRPE